MSKRAYSLGTAKNALKLLFGDANTGTVTPEQAFYNAGRGDKDSETNFSWLYNKLAALRQFRLVEVRKEAVEGKIKIIDATLTAAGRELLNQGLSVPQNDLAGQALSPPHVGPSAGRQVTLQSISDDIDEFVRQNPSWELELIPKRVNREGQAPKQV